MEPKPQLLTSGRALVPGAPPWEALARAAPSSTRMPPDSQLPPPSAPFLSHGHCTPSDVLEKPPHLSVSHIEGKLWQDERVRVSEQLHSGGWAPGPQPILAVSCPPPLPSAAGCQGAGNTKNHTVTPALTIQSLTCATHHPLPGADQKCRIPGPLWPIEPASAISHGCQALRHTRGGGLDREAMASEPSTCPGGSPHLGALEPCLPLQGAGALITIFSHWAALSRESMPVHALSQPCSRKETHAGSPGSGVQNKERTNGLVSAEARAQSLPCHRPPTTPIRGRGGEGTCGPPAPAGGVFILCDGIEMPSGEAHKT